MKIMIFVPVPVPGDSEIHDAAVALVGAADSLDIEVFRGDQASEGGFPADVIRLLAAEGPAALPLTTVDGRVVLSGKLPTPDELERMEAVGSAVQWPTSKRIHISLDVHDVAASVPFYEVFFGIAPVKVRRDYAKFELANPPLNITLSEVAADQPARLNHFGIQVLSADVVLEARETYGDAGFHVVDELSVVCCYAEQHKIWVADPDGNHWEVVTVAGDVDADEACPSDCICYAHIEPSTVAIASPP